MRRVIEGEDPFPRVEVQAVVTRCVRRGEKGEAVQVVEGRYGCEGERSRRGGIPDDPGQGCWSEGLEIGRIVGLSNVQVSVDVDGEDTREGREQGQIHPVRTVEARRSDEDAREDQR